MNIPTREGSIKTVNIHSVVWSLDPHLDTILHKHLQSPDKDEIIITWPSISELEELTSEQYARCSTRFLFEIWEAYLRYWNSFKEEEANMKGMHALLSQIYGHLEEEGNGINI